MQAEAFDAQTNDVEELNRLATQQRRKLVEDLTQLRKHDIAYLRELHADPRKSYFLNVALLQEDDLSLVSVLTPENHQKRCEQLYFLGLSLGRILTSATSPSQVVVDSCQLMDELDFYFSQSGIQNMKLVTVATKSPLYEREPKDSFTEPYRTVVRKWNNKPVYQRLVTPNVPFPLEYCQVVVSLCEVLTLVYGRVVDDVCSSNPCVFQALLRFDEKIKKFFLESISKQLTTIATSVIKDELALLRKATA
ncbi:Aste57867_13517 [Aphanomyces stellatus]|uniref:Aste57867_13517 protein n=1 Tax=Aphanomyces stellatus TaxID=120398 RepID=A0A485KZ76_9STRA|nr:hypothetical protein As57867_013467 [Aphanomyces stellatus]VFT90355.1 Aste57867_13517 [Aphanomyces stellatus]